MASEDQDILAKISLLAGQINRHKNTQQTAHADSYRQAPYPQYSGANARGNISQVNAGWRGGRGVYSSRGYGRGGRPAQVHRHRTLVLNGNAPNGETGSTSAGDENENENPSVKTTATPSYVTKTDRHLQLINTSIFEKDSQNRAKAMEETRQQKLKQRDDREKLKFNKHLQRIGSGPSSRSASTPGSYQIDVQGILFNIAKNGSKLVKIPGDVNYAKSTPKTALVGGVQFHRSKNGNMYRSGVIKAHRRNGVVRKVNEPCKMFTTTGTTFQHHDPLILCTMRQEANARVEANICSVLGSCLKGPKCRYIHDPSKVAVCKEFLQKGSCPSGDSCDLSHDLTPERTPTCLHFGKGNCSNPNCRYTHVHVSPSALNCRAFGVYGYCEKGASCPERHAFECPDFANTGSCTMKGCKLLHRHKASVIRRNTAGGETAAADENSDLSSDEEEIDSDDVDSDDLEEYFGDDDGQIDTDVPMQQDFVQLS